MMNAKKSPKPLARSLSMAQFVSVVNMEHLEKLQDLWSQLDSNRKGLVSANDLKEVMKSVNVDASDEEVTELVKELDSDGDGKISFRDFAKGVMRKQKQLSPTTTLDEPPPANKFTSPNLRGSGELAAKFNSASLNSPILRTSSDSAKSTSATSPNSRPPSASAVPASVASKPAASPQLQKANTAPLSTSPTKTPPVTQTPPATQAPATTLQKAAPATALPTQTASPQLQKAKTQTIAAPGSPSTPKFSRSPSVVQFVKHLTGPQLAEMQTLFNHYDKDRDGRIDYSSVRSIIKDINPAIQSDDIQELLGAIDSDHDGLVNFKEFIDGIVMVYRKNTQQAEQVVKSSASEGGPLSKGQMIAKLTAESTAKDQVIDQLRKEIDELQRENQRLKAELHKKGKG